MYIYITILLYGQQWQVLCGKMMDNDQFWMIFYWTHDIKSAKTCKKIPQSDIQMIEHDDGAWDFRGSHFQTKPIGIILWVF